MRNPLIATILFWVIVIIGLCSLFLGCAIAPETVPDLAYMSEGHLDELCDYWKGKDIHQLSKYYPAEMFKVEAMKNGNVRLTAILQGVLAGGTERIVSNYSYSFLELHANQDGTIVYATWKRVYSTR